MTEKKEKSELELLKEKLCFKKKSGWDGINKDEAKEIQKLNEEYKKFLNNCKTEREAVAYIEQIAQQHGYVNIEEATKEDKKLFINFDNVSCVLVNINHFDFAKGFLMIGSHIDTPRLDLKGFPLYESEDMAYLKTHYYGGIKKYQWVTRPLAMHGTVILESGKNISFVIGENEDEPVFTINDLLPHLAQEQITKEGHKIIEGENLNILVGSIPYKFKQEADAVKMAVLNYLYEKYGFKEEDFVSAEIQLVPAGKARDIGFDKSFVGSHGQDDRVCSFTGMQALFDAHTDSENLLMMFFDKEEIGSKGNAGANSNILERAVNKILKHYQKENYCDLIESLANSKFLSADVNAGIEPEWANVFEKNNSAKIGSGVCLTKFTGARGKSGSNEAHAEFVAECRQAFNQEKALWQTAELGKVDQGGGGTIAMYIAEYGMQVVDCGTAVLSMHAPFEVVSKADVYHTYLAYRGFYNRLKTK